MAINLIYTTIVVYLIAVAVSEPENGRDRIY
jgi:hypothetical protein